MSLCGALKHHTLTVTHLLDTKRHGLMGVWVYGFVSLSLFWVYGFVSLSLFWVSGFLWVFMGVYGCLRVFMGSCLWGRVFVWGDPTCCLISPQRKNAFRLAGGLEAGPQGPHVLRRAQRPQLVWAAGQRCVGHMFV